MADLTPPNTGSEALNEYLTRLQQVVNTLDLRKIPEEGWSLTDLRADVSEVISDKRDIIDVANEAASKLAEVKALVMDLDGYEQSLEEAEAFKVAAESLIDWYDQNEVSIRILLGMVNKPGGAAELIEAFDAIRVEAANSAAKAKTSETNAKASETAAASSKTAAATSATNAKTSETNAATSATNAANSATASANSATAASTSEGKAKTSETNAKASETAAASSKTAAATSATNAKTSETNAATSATNAANSATASANSATDAANSANSITDGAEVATFKAAEAAAAADRAEQATAGKADLIGGKVPTSQIPEIALTKPFSVTSRTALLALNAQEGDIGIITTGADKGSYVLGTGPSNVFSSWVPLAVSADSPVQSVNGQTGTVVLNAEDVGASPTGHTHAMAQITDLPKVTYAVTNSAIVQRLSTGQISVPTTPNASQAATSKSYVDTRVATKANTTHTHTSSQISDKVSGVWTTSTTDNRVVATSGGGYLQTSKSPVVGSDVTNKIYVDTQISTHKHVPADIGASFAATANTIPLRDSGGRLAAMPPVAPGQVATKLYVDQRPALFSGAGKPPSSIPGAVAGDMWLNLTTMDLYRITGV